MFEELLEIRFFSFLGEIFHTKIFLASFLAWLFAQFTKSVISLVVNILAVKKIKQNITIGEQEDIRMVRDMMSSLFWKTGGMPSSHASMSTALTTSIGFEYGFTSSLFFVTFFFTTIVVRDATGVRLLAGKIARVTNLLIAKYNITAEKPERIEQLKVVEGHTFSEVFVGIMLGIFISVIIYLF